MPTTEPSKLGGKPKVLPSSRIDIPYHPDNAPPALPPSQGVSKKV